VAGAASTWAAAGAECFFATGLGGSGGGSAAGGGSGTAAGAVTTASAGADGCRCRIRYDTPVAASAPVRNPRMSFWFNSDTSLYYYNAAAH
jgi:hypothetical protein